MCEKGCERMCVRGVRGGGSGSMAYLMTRFEFPFVVLSSHLQGVRGGVR